MTSRPRRPVPARGRGNCVLPYSRWNPLGSSKEKNRNVARMKNRLAIGSVAVAAAVVAGMIFAETGGDTPPGFFPYTDMAAVAAGADVYAAHCASCHGVELEGQPDWRVPGPNGRLPAPPHDATGHTWHHPDAQLFEIVKYGTAAVVGRGYESDMPGFEDVLSDDDISAVMAYIKSTWPGPVIDAHNEVNARTSVTR